MNGEKPRELEPQPQQEPEKVLEQAEPVFEQKEKIKIEEKIEEELSEKDIEKIMDKVKDPIDEQTRRGLGVHNMGGEGDGINTRNIEGGLFKTEKVLTYGLLSPRFSEKLGVRTSHGYGGRSNMVEMHPLTNDNYYKSGTMPKAWSILVDASKARAEGKKGINIRVAERRIPPKYFAGITIDHQLLGEDIVKWLG